MKGILAVIFYVMIAVTLAVIPECPKDGHGNERLPDSEDCGKFYYCKDYVPHPAFCPPRLRFDIKTLTCIDAAQATCIPTATTPTSENTTTYPPVQCPEQEDPDDNVLIPNPKDCATYYQCVWGTPILKKCPRGLHFNNKIKRCDWPRNVNCTITP